jgi:hypothetical protein
MIRTAESASPATTRLRTAVGVALLGAVCAAAGPAFRVVEGGASPAFTAWPLLAVLAFLPTGLAVWFLKRNREVSAAAALVPPAVFGVGAVFADLQIALDPLNASRPELFRPETLGDLTASTGAWLLIAGHLLTIAAGVLAATGVEPEGQTDRARFGLPATAGVLAAVGLLMAPFTSTDALIPGRGPLDAPALALTGGLLIALAAPVTAVIAASAGPDARRGGLTGLAVVLVTLALPPLAAAAAVDRVEPAAGPFLVLVAAAAMLLPHRKQARDLALPGRSRLLLTAAVLGGVAGVCAIVSALTDHLTLPAGLPAPTDYAARQLWPAAVITLATAALITKARPAFTVATATVPLAAAGALDAVFAATQVDAVQPGPGVWFAVAATVAAAAAAMTAGIAGAVERDEEGVTTTAPTLPLIATALVAALLAVGAFGLPVITAPDYVPSSAFGLRLGSWGLLIGLIAVLAAIAIALRSRPNRGAALLFGAALVAVTRALEFPLTAGRAVETQPGPGLWLAIATAAALVIAAAVRTAR